MIDESISKISIIVPVYNVEKYLDKCVESLTKQTYKNLEIILVDDGSMDNCPSICDEWAKKDERIKVIHKENGGLSDARNIGVKSASGDYISFVDGDDVVCFDMYKILVNMIEKDDADICVCQFDRFIDGNNPNYNINYDVTVLNKDDALKELLSEKLTNHVCNKLFKRKLFENIAFPVGKTYEDAYVFYKILLKTNKICITDSKLYGYMQRADSITNKCTSKSVEDYINAINIRYDELKADKYLEYYLNISKIKNAYTSHVKAASTNNKDFYFSNIVLEEYNFLKKKMNLKNLKIYLEDGNYKTKIYKIILLLNRKLFWKLITRK